MKFRQTLVKATVGTCALYTFFDIVGHPAQVVGSSMYPTLHGEDARWFKRDFVWLSTWSLYKCSPGTILTFISPRDPSSTYIKRITAVEGQIVRPERLQQLFTEIPKGHYWMEGDNPVNRNDSNVFGPVSSSLVKGRATHIIWPPNRWQRL
uniref:Mitochondrial inner membrane protease subunit 2 n=1 Tax=Caenorhabditis japonica TaxID=281687 RepID=A0A8R1DWE2_CAEJA